MHYNGNGLTMEYTIKILFRNDIRNKRYDAAFRQIDVTFS